MHTLWFYSNSATDENKLTEMAHETEKEIKSNGLKCEVIVYSKVREVLGRGLKEDAEGKSVFAERLGFLGNLLHKNGVIVLIVAPNVSLEDRTKVKNTHGNYIQASLGGDDKLTDITLSNAKQVLEYLNNKKLISV